jgi:hypothetical protein
LDRAFAVTPTQPHLFQSLDMTAATLHSWIELKPSDDGNYVSDLTEVALFVVDIYDAPTIYALRSTTYILIGAC